MVLSVATGVVNFSCARLDDISPERNGADYLDAFAWAASVERFTSILGIVTAVLAILVVRQVTALVRAPREAADPART